MSLIEETWTLADWTKIVSRGWHIRAEDGSAVAIVLGENLKAETGDCARLIVAAPDMLKALQKVRELHNNPDMTDEDEVIDHVNKAIEKAKGNV